MKLEQFRSLATGDVDGSQKGAFRRSLFAWPALEQNFAACSMDFGTIPALLGSLDISKFLIKDGKCLRQYGPPLPPTQPEPS